MPVIKNKLMINLKSGQAYIMGGGIFIVFKVEADRKVADSVVVMEQDIHALQYGHTSTIPLEDGTAEYLGDGGYLVNQFDETTRTWQCVELTRQDLEALRAAA